MKRLLNYLKPLFGALLLAVIFRSFLFEPFHIPSASMRGTLVEGDYIFVSKFSYGYSKYSFPFSLPIFSGRILYNEPKRGDVVVFRPKHDNGVSYIKRLVGLPGDQIQMIGGSLHINGQKVKRERVEDYHGVDIDGNEYIAAQYQETLDTGKSYAVLDYLKNSISDDTPIYEVPADHFFVLGDNRDNSRDSRFLHDIGYIPAENLVGRAAVVALSFSKSSKLPFPFSLDFSRLWLKL